MLPWSSKNAPPELQKDPPELQKDPTDLRKGPPGLQKVSRGCHIGAPEEQKWVPGGFRERPGFQKVSPGFRQVPFFGGGIFCVIFRANVILKQQ